MRLTDLNFILGERKIIQFEVVSTKKNEAVIITDAAWALTRQGATVLSGSCTIENNIMEILLEPDQEGTFELMITYTIAPEVRKVRCVVNVC